MKKTRLILSTLAAILTLSTVAQARDVYASRYADYGRGQRVEAVRYGSRYAYDRHERVVYAPRQVVRCAPVAVRYEAPVRYVAPVRYEAPRCAVPAPVVCAAPVSVRIVAPLLRLPGLHVSLAANF